MELVSNCTQISVLPAVNQLICNVVIYILNPPWCNKSYLFGSSVVQRERERQETTD